jgi:HNH endonuclease
VKRGIFHKRSIDVCVGELIFATPLRPETLVFAAGEQIVVAVPKNMSGGVGEYQFLFTVEEYEGDNPDRADALFGRPAWRHLYRLGAATTIDPFSLDDLVAAAGPRGDEVRERYRGQTQHHRIVRDVYAEDEPLFQTFIHPHTEPVWIASGTADDNELAPTRRKARQRTRDDIVRRLKTINRASAGTTPGKQYRPGKSQKRNAEFTELIRALYEDTCQVCGTQLLGPNGIPRRSQVHHIEPWNGDHSDRLDNVICLRPNDHALFEIKTLRWQNDTLSKWEAGAWVDRPLAVDLHLTVPINAALPVAVPH